MNTDTRRPYRIILIAALSQNRIIGEAGGMPWHLPDDLKQFRKATLQRPIIMGRKTYESIGKPLKKRTNIILTRDTTFHVDGIFTVHSIDEALQLAEQHLGDQREIIIGGGAEIYRQFLPIATDLRLTYVDATIPGDTYFPDISLDQWGETSRSVHPIDDRHDYRFEIVTYTRKS